MQQARSGYVIGVPWAPAARQPPASRPPASDTEGMKVAGTKTIGAWYAYQERFHVSHNVLQ
ncbi:MAG TPA: hypothetical protein VFW76_08115 [Ktedonobacterales bacterium]|nr:hypothetical protein [Ktedonobacterales bacterium]